MNPQTVLVASKGRPHSNLFRRLEEESLEFRVFVEPQEYEDYRQAVNPSRLVRLGESNLGLAYARQEVMDWASRTGLRWYWNLDDDIRSLGLAVNGACLSRPCRQVLLAAESLLLGVRGLGQGALEYRQYAWRSPARAYGSYCDVAVLNNVELSCFVSWRESTGVKCDRDYTMQVLAAGYKTCRAGRCWFDAPRNASNLGGLHDVYAVVGREERDVRELVLLWPRVAEVQRKGDRVDARICWRKLARPQEPA
jgi:hypothetical protein